MSGKGGTQAAREALAQKILVGCGLFGAMIGVGHALDITPSRPVLFVGALFVLVVGFWISVLYWRSIDEAAREAHKFAWFWGASCGILVIPVLAALISSERLVMVLGERSPGGWVFVGISAVLAVQIIGYGLVWAGWWLRQR